MLFNNQVKLFRDRSDELRFSSVHKKISVPHELFLIPPGFSLPGSWRCSADDFKVSDPYDLFSLTYCIRNGD